MKPLVLSIIVPVYNVLEYLEACVDSLVAEDMNLAEVILVDDGSTDGSSALCDELAKRYTCVRCIHKENEGVSMARNDGLNEARGKYVVFVDSDDLIALDGVAAAINWAKDADDDICFLQFQDLYPNGNLKDHGDNITLSEVRGKDKKTVFRHLASRPKYPGSACAKLFRREFLCENGIHFIKGRKNGEDLSFMMECLLSARRFDALEMPFYQYRRNRVDSATYKMNTQSYQQRCMFVTEWSEQLTWKKKPKNSISSYAMSFVAYEYAILLWRCVDLPEDTLEYAGEFLEKYSWVMHYARNRRIKTIGLLQKALGTKRTSLLLKTVKG